jgi:hypothetical protein
MKRVSYGQASPPCHPEFAGDPVASVAGSPVFFKGYTLIPENQGKKTLYRVVHTHMVGDYNEVMKCPSKQR